MMVGRLQKLTRELDGSQVISISVKADFAEEFDELKDKPITVDIRKYRKSRSLPANAQAWVLINKIAQKLQEKEPLNGWTPEEVYKNAVRDVAGACSIHLLPNDQVERFVDDWVHLGTGFQVELFPSDVEGFTCGKFWKGSHLFDTQEMSTLIHILIQEAEQQGIPTLSEEEVNKMLGAWRKGGKKNGAGKAAEESA